MVTGSSLAVGVEEESAVAKGRSGITDHSLRNSRLEGDEGKGIGLLVATGELNTPVLARRLNLLAAATSGITLTVVPLTLARRRDPCALPGINRDLIPFENRRTTLLLPLLPPLEDLRLDARPLPLENLRAAPVKLNLRLVGAVLLLAATGVGR